MNAAHQAASGLPPALFPKDLPVFMGHYHLPQTVAGTNITYVGSPYQGMCKGVRCLVFSGPGSGMPFV